METVRIEALLGENNADVTMPAWPCNVFVHSPVSTLQILATQSPEIVSTLSPSIENTPESTPEKLLRHAPDSTHQIRALLSQHVMRTEAPSGAKAADFRASVC